MPDHVHVMLRIPSKYPVSQVAGFVKCKSAMEKTPACYVLRSASTSGARMTRRIGLNALSVPIIKV